MKTSRAVEKPVDSKKEAHRENNRSVEASAPNHAHRKNERTVEPLGKPGAGPGPSATERGDDGPSKKGSSPDTENVSDSTVDSTASMPEPTVTSIILPDTKTRGRPAPPLSPKQIVSLQRWKRAGIEVKVIAREFGIDESTVYKYTKDTPVSIVEPAQPSPTAATSHQDPAYTATAPVNGNGGAAAQSQSQPSAEYVQSSQQQEKHEVGNGGEVKPYELNFPLTLGLDSETVLALHGRASIAGFKKLTAYLNERLYPDSRLADVVREGLGFSPDASNEEIEATFLNVMREWVAYRKTLARAKEEATRELMERMEKKNNVSPNQ